MHNIDVYVKFINDRTRANTLFTRRSAVGRADARLYLESQLPRGRELSYSPEEASIPLAQPVTWWLKK